MDTILIVEDNEELRNVLKYLLERTYRVLTAPAGEEGIDLALAHRPELVILDLQLPAMDGIEAGKRIKSELGQSVPILVLTALSGRAEAEAVLGSGCCDAFMAKPAPLASIESKVAELLAGRTAA
ncbi:MAG TPA: response regulator [Longimicrobiales bacterium]|nr:response regulator [Longimicrobiales bacterium]